MAAAARVVEAMIQFALSYSESKPVVADAPHEPK
jgi:hypothetical protein